MNWTENSLKKLVGDRNALNIQHLQRKIKLVYFYTMPKIYKEPWATGPVVSDICSVMKPLSK